LELVTRAEDEEGKKQPSLGDSTLLIETKLVLIGSWCRTGG